MWDGQVCFDRPNCTHLTTGSEQHRIKLTAQDMHSDVQYVKFQVSAQQIAYVQIILQIIINGNRMNCFWVNREIAVVR